VTHLSRKRAVRIQNLDSKPYQGLTFRPVVFCAGHNMSALLRGRFEATTKARAVVDLQSAISELDQLRSELNGFIRREEKRTGVSDRTRYTYSTVAVVARERVLKLNQSIAELTAKLEVALEERDRAAAALAALETTAKLFRRKR
jgi:hypothetical protein